MEVVSRATLAIALHLSDWDREQGDALGRPTFMETVISRVGAGVVGTLASPRPGTAFTTYYALDRP